MLWGVYVIVYMHMCARVCICVLCVYDWGPAASGVSPQKPPICFRGRSPTDSELREMIRLARHPRDPYVSASHAGITSVCHQVELSA